MSGLAPKWVRLAPNGTNPGILRSEFSTFFPFWSQSDPLWSLTSLRQTCSSDVYIACRLLSNLKTNRSSEGKGGCLFYISVCINSYTFSWLTRNDSRKSDNWELPDLHEIVSATIFHISNCVLVFSICGGGGSSALLFFLQIIHVMVLVYTAYVSSKYVWHLDSTIFLFMIGKGSDCEESGFTQGFKTAFFRYWF